MTEQLHLADDTVASFEATVKRVLEDRIVLDRTHFYPTGGGQPHDTGHIRVLDDAVNTTARDAVVDTKANTENGDTARWAVIDVQKSDTVYHTIEPVGDDQTTDHMPVVDSRIVGEIDWNRRHAHAKYHTAQHLLSALLVAEYDAPTTGNQLYTDHAHLDAAYDRFDTTDLDDIERRLNDLVADDRPVTSTTMDRETAEATLDTDRTRIDLLPASITELRIVEIASCSGEETPYDRTACAGTHVERTSEIGEIIVTGRETKGSNEERIRFELADHRQA